jgi:hypothetical protein
MKSDQHCFINGKKIEEFYWNGRLVVYVDNKLTTEKYLEVCKRELILQEEQKK